MYDNHDNRDYFVRDNHFLLFSISPNTSPKHDTLIHFKMLAAALILEPLSVVMQTCCLDIDSILA